MQRQRRAVAPPATDYTVFTHVVDAGGKLWAQWDNPPVHGTYPTGQWSANETVFDQYMIPLDEAMPPGTYTVLVGLYEPATGIRLVALDTTGRAIGDFVQLSQPVKVP